MESGCKEKLAEAKAEAYKKILENEKKKVMTKKKENNSKTRQYKGKKFASYSKGQREEGRGHGRGRGTINNPKL